MSRKGLKVLVDSLTRSAKHFNKSEVECLVKLFDTLVAKASSDYAGAGFDRTVFRDILHSAFGMTDEVVLDRVFSIFDRDNNGYITVAEWVEGLAVLLRGTLEEKMKLSSQARPVPTFIYWHSGDTVAVALAPAVLQLESTDGKIVRCIYDLNGDGYISREEMFQMLKNSLLIQPADEEPDEGVKDLVEIALKKMDHDHDGKLSFTDFEKAVRDENLLLEAFGPCFPDIKSNMLFEQKFFRETPK